MSAHWKWPNGSDGIPTVTDEWGIRAVNPATGVEGAMHWGIDLIIPDYTNRSVADGEVVFAAYNGGAGNEVRVQHPGGTVTKYKHNAYFAAGIGVGAQVKMGQPLGRMGSTGDSTGDHLHLETLLTLVGPNINPRDFMAARFAEDSGGTLPAGIPGTSTPASASTQPLGDSDMPTLIRSADYPSHTFMVWPGHVACVDGSDVGSMVLNGGMKLLELSRDQFVGVLALFKLDKDFPDVNTIYALATIPENNDLVLVAEWARSGSTSAPGTTTDAKAIAAAVDAALADNFAAVLTALANVDEATLATFGLKRA